MKEKLLTSFEKRFEEIWKEVAGIKSKYKNQTRDLDENQFEIQKLL